MKNYLASIAALALASGLSAGSTGIGGTFVDSGLGARPLGMGGAFVAVADDANAVQENPAGLGLLEATAHVGTFTHINLYDLAELSRDFAAYGQGDNGYGAYGGSWSRMALNLNPETWTEDAFSLVVAKSLGGVIKPDSPYPRLSFGLQGKYLLVDSGFNTVNPGLSVSGGNASGYSVSAGFLARMTEGFSVGLAAQDVYSSLLWGSGTKEVLPMTAKGGLAYKIKNTQLAIEGRGRQGSGGMGFSSYHVGAEQWLLSGKTLLWDSVRNFGLRTGYAQQPENEDGGQLSLGASVKADLWSVDYSYQFGFAESQLGATHRFGFGVFF